MGRPKKNPQTTEETKTTKSTSVLLAEERTRIKQVITNFTADRTPMIERHLEHVKRNTGTIDAEDVSYVVSLFTRELNHLIQDNVL